MRYKTLALSLSAGLLLALAACGGGGASTPTATTPTATVSGASAGAVSSGSISAFGSVFVNGHEFDTKSASVVDDDTGTSTTGTSGLEVGMVIDVKAASSSTDAKPVAGELHLHPMARGYVDATDSAVNTITVMGQTVQLSSTTIVSDHRACVSAAVSPCTAITGQGGLTVTSGTGAAAVAGSYVAVHGYLFGGASGSTNIEAALVSIHDAPPTTAAGAVFKAEGVISAVSANAITIGGLNVDLSAATCRVKGNAQACAGMFSVGQVASAFAKAQPSLPVTGLTADVVVLRPKAVVETAGATVELEGKVTSVTASPASFVVRGINVDATGLPAGTALPAVGDDVEVVGTVASTGTSIAATSLKIEHKAGSAKFGFEGDAGNVAAGTSANTFTLTVLGQTITVNTNTRLADHSVKNWDDKDPALNPFNISTFQTYLAASTSQHVMIKAEADASGNLTALGLLIVPASLETAIVGKVDATPAPVNSTATGTPSTFSVHGVAVSADPAAIRGSVEGHQGMMPAAPAVTIAGGDWVAVFGSYNSGTLTVTATQSRKNAVIDFGTTGGHEMEGF